MSHLLGTTRKYAILNGMFYMLVILIDTRLPASQLTPLHSFHLTLQVVHIPHLLWEHQALQMVPTKKKPKRHKSGRLNGHSCDPLGTGDPTIHTDSI
jgi:hypothetical protein